MRYFSVEDILQIHSFIIDETGGSHGVRERGMLEGIVAAPQQAVFGKELYPSIFLKAAVYMRDIIANHPFVDGNKRTAATATGVFLEDNGYVFVAKPGEIEAFALAVISEKHSVEAIALWLERHAKLHDETDISR